MIRRNLRITTTGSVALNAAIILCMVCTMATAQSPREGRLAKKEVRENRSRAESLDRPVAKTQPIHLMRFDTKSVEVLGDHWPSEQVKNDEVTKILDMIDTQIRNRLLRAGFNCTFERDLPTSETARHPDAVVIEGVLAQAGRGKEHPVIAVTVTVRDAKDPNIVYGKFSDGGMVGQVTARVANRFRLTIEE